jgi:hypothetical protein
MPYDQDSRVGVTMADARPLAWKERVPWLLEFANTDLVELGRGRPGDRMNFLDDLRRYVGATGEKEQDELARAAGGDLTAISPAIDTARELLTAIADRAVVEFRFEAGGGGMLDASPLKDGWRAPEVYYDRPLREMVLLLALEDLRQADVASLVRRCRWSECGNLFFAKRKDQEYCDRPCANNAATHEYQKRQKAKKTQTAPRETGPSDRPAANAPSLRPAEAAAPPVMKARAQRKAKRPARKRKGR